MPRWITEWLGTSAWDCIEPSPDIYLVDVRDLVDKDGNPLTLVKSKIDEALVHLQQGKKVVVCCDYGMSRSNAIAAGILAKREGIDIEDAIRLVLITTGEEAIKLEMLSTIRQALGKERQKLSLSKTSSHRLLLTGASGFIGSSLLEMLKLKHQVVAPTHQNIDLTHDTVSFDLLVKEHEIDTIIHLANPRVYTANEAMGTTLLMLKNILDVCKANKLNLVYLSGWEIYSGYKTQELKADELLAPCPGGTYGQTKWLCELLIEHYSWYYQVPVLILRPSPVYGPGSNRPRFIWNFLEIALNNKEIVTHKYINGFPKLDLLHIDDLCVAVTSAIEHEAEGTINLGTGVGLSTTEVAEYIIKCVDSKSRIRHIDIEGYTSNIIMDTRRAVTMLGWQPVVDLNQGLETIINVRLTQTPQIV